MYNIRAPNIGNAHEQTVRKIIRDGLVVDNSDYGSLERYTLELPEPLNIHIATPLEEPYRSERSEYSISVLQEYADALLFGYDKKNDFTYTYHDRLFRNVDVGQKQMRVAPIDQIQECINKLKKSPTTRRAQATIWHPIDDLFGDEPPCLQHVQFLIRDGKLNTSVLFRSNDMFRAADANMYALVRLQEHVAKEVGVNIGWYSHTSISPHIYFARDETSLLKFTKGWIEHVSLERILYEYEIWG